MTGSRGSSTVHQASCGGRDEIPNVRGFSHVEVTVTDLERSLSFYRDLLGLHVFQQACWVRLTTPASTNDDPTPRIGTRCSSEGLP
jgi:hypothetical protein